MNQRAWRAPGALALWLILASLGCGRVTVVDGSGPVGEAPVGVAHDLAVTGIDFQPARSALSSEPSAELTLLVVLENRGTESEREVTVNLTLQSAGGGEVLLKAQRRIAELAAGQTRLERFTVAGSVPLRSGYTLTVEVEPVAGETLLSNNTRVYQLQLSGE